MTLRLSMAMASSFKEVAKYRKMNSIESVADTPSDTKAAHSQRVVQLKGYQRKYKANLENISIHIINENATSDLHTYPQQK